MVGRTFPCWGHSLLSQHHFGSSHLGLSCYLASVESLHCHFQVILTSHLFVYFRVAKAGKKLKSHCFLLICLPWETGSPPDQA